MKVAGTFNPVELYHKQKTACRNTSFSAMLAFNLDKKPGEDDITALFASNQNELERLYEEMTGKKLDNEANDRTVVFAFWNRVTLRNHYNRELSGVSGEDIGEWLIPVANIPSNQNMRCITK